MTRYGSDHYGQNPDGSFVYYGLSYPVAPTPLPTPPPVPVAPIISVDPFTATALNYNSVALNWTQPASTAWLDFRLLSNRYGFPVDENDGTILIDSNGPNWPGSSFLDTNIIPGTYHHYAVYMLIGPGAARTAPVPTGPAPPPNLVKNFASTFINGNGATQLATTGGGTVSLTPNVPHGAPYPYGIKYNAPGGGTSTYFTYPTVNPIVVQPNTTYTVSCWVYTPTDQIWLGLKFQDSTILDNLITVNVNTWTLVSTQITSPSNATSATFKITGSKSTIFPPYTMSVTGLTLQQGTTSGATIATPLVPAASNVWVRAGFAACLVPNNFNTTQFLLDTIPTYYKQITDTELTTAANLNPTLQAFLSIIAWSIDYIKTALFVRQNANNPDVIPVNDVFNLASTLGFPQETEISPGVVRRAIKNTGALVKQRGTPEGLVAYVTNLAGFAIDLQAGYNLMLDDNQSDFSYPGGLADGRRRSMLDVNTPSSLWSPTQVYQTNDIANYGSYKYISIIANNLNNTPSGAATSTSQWQVLYYTSIINIGGYITNPLTGWPSTYEPRSLVAANQNNADPAGLEEILGVLDPLNAGKYHHNGLLINNNSAIPSTFDLRSVSRLPSDITAGNLQPDPSQVVGDGIPVPYTLPTQQWSATDFSYQTGDIVVYQGLPFIALKESYGVAPPTNYIATNEWQPLGYDGRIQLMASMYSIANNGNSQVSIQPYVYFYDQYGYPIAQLFPRTAGGGQQFEATLAATTNLAFNHTSASVLTASANGVTVIDGVSITSTSQNVLLAGQSSANDNGYYDVVQVGTASAPTKLQRYNNSGATMPGSYAYVSSGAANGGLTFYCTNTGTVLLGTTPITFSTTPPNQSFYPGALLFDSFAKPSDWGTNLTAHQPEVGGATPANMTWAAYSNDFKLSAFASGTITPSVTTAQCLDAVNYGTTNAMVGVDIVTQPTGPGFIMGIAGRVASATSYIRVDQNNIVTRNGTILTVLATHSVTARPGDRLTALFNGNTITAYVNGTQVSSATSSFNNTSTVFGPIYEGATVYSGSTQPVTARVWPRRARTLTRARVQSLPAVFNNAPPKFVGTSNQPESTRMLPRRRVARALVGFKPVTTTNRYNGTVQPRATLANQRLLSQRSRAHVGGMMQAADNTAVVTTNLRYGTVQPETTRMLARRRTSRALVNFKPVRTTNTAVGSVQARTAMPAQRLSTQRHRSTGGHTVYQSRGPSGLPIHQLGLVSQRSVQQRHRSVSAHSAFQSRGPSGTLQRTGFVAQRSLQQRERASVGRMGMVAAGHGFTTNTPFGTVQPRAATVAPRRTSTRGRIIRQPGARMPAYITQPLAALPSQRSAKQRNRAVIKGNMNWEVGPEQPRGPSGTIQPFITLPKQRSPRQRARAVFTTRYVSTYNLSYGKEQPEPTVTTGGTVIRNQRRSRGKSGKR